jgi:hypothetical protein
MAMPQHDQQSEFAMNRRMAVVATGGIGIALATLGRSSALAQDASPATAPGPTGVTMEAMGNGLPAASPNLELTLRTTIIAPGGRMPNHTHPGAIILYIEAGSFGYTLLDGTMNFARATTDGTPPVVEEGEIGTEVILTAGDWMFMDEDQDDSRNAGDDDVVLIVAALTVVGEPFSTFLAE